MLDKHENADNRRTIFSLTLHQNCPGIPDHFKWLCKTWLVGGIHNSPDTTHVLKVLKKAVSKHGHPEINHSDKGRQFICSLWIEYLERSDIKISMDGMGRVIDNVFIERF